MIVSPPTLPKNISSIKINLEAREREGVIPFVKPTVATADATSNIESKREMPSMRLIETVPRIKKVIYITKIVAADKTVSSGMVLFRHSVFFFFLNTENRFANKTAIVFIFIPPAVEPDAPPISIRIIITKIATSLICEKSAVLKPAVLGVTA